MHTRANVRLLGPCFKTGRIQSFSQRRRVQQEKPRAGQARPQNMQPDLNRRAGLPPMNTHIHTTARRTTRHTPLVSNGSAAQLHSLLWRGAENHCKNHCKTHPGRRHTCLRAHLAHNNQAEEQPISSASLPGISGTFNSLSKVLFTFPSRYLYAIRLEIVFSFGWNLPPN